MSVLTNNVRNWVESLGGGCWLVPDNASKLWRKQHNQPLVKVVVLGTDNYFDHFGVGEGFVKGFSSVSGYFAGKYFILDKPLVYVTSVGDEAVAVVLQKGFMFNGANIPLIARPLVGSPFVSNGVGEYRRAAAVHDALCDVHYFNSDTTHRIFSEIVEVDLEEGLTNWLLRKSVEGFGPRFEKNTNLHILNGIML